jgi:hypothetical protein
MLMRREASSSFPQSLYLSESPYSSGQWTVPGGEGLRRAPGLLLPVRGGPGRSRARSGRGRRGRDAREREILVARAPAGGRELPRREREDAERDAVRKPGSRDGGQARDLDAIESRELGQLDEVALAVETDRVPLHVRRGLRVVLEADPLDRDASREARIARSQQRDLERLVLARQRRLTGERALERAILPRVCDQLGAVPVDGDRGRRWSCPSSVPERRRLREPAEGAISAALAAGTSTRTNARAGTAWRIFMASPTLRPLRYDGPAGLSIGDSDARIQASASDPQRLPARRRRPRLDTGATARKNVVSLFAAARSESPRIIGERSMRRFPPALYLYAALTLTASGTALAQSATTTTTTTTTMSASAEKPNMRFIQQFGVDAAIMDKQWYGVELRYQNGAVPPLEKADGWLITPMIAISPFPNLEIGGEAPFISY